MSPETRLALVTGAGVRLGRALAEGLAGRGYRLALHYHHHRDEAEELAEKIRARGPATSPPMAACFRADLEDPSSAPVLVANVEASLGPCDVLVLSAAVYPEEPLASITAASFERTLRINLTSPFLLAVEAGLRMKARGAGRILMLLDWSIDRPYPDRIPYTIAKAGLRAAVFGLARALAPEVTVNGIAPGAVLLPEGSSERLADRIRTATPLERIGEPRDVLEAALFLIESEFTTGTVLTVDGGRSVV